MEVNSIEQKIDIKASAEKVWNVLWNQETYKKWGSKYMEGAHYTGELEEGKDIKFIDQEGSGMQSRVLKIDKNREIIFNHLFVLDHGNRGDSLDNMEERYFLDENNNVTHLTVNIEVAHRDREELNQSTTFALREIKALAEGNEFDI